MVASVKYVLFWNGNGISKILTRIVLYKSVTLSSSLLQMFEVRWNYLPALVNDSLGFNGVNYMSDYDSLITSNAYIDSLRSGIKGERYKKNYIKTPIKKSNFFFQKLKFSTKYTVSKYPLVYLSFSLIKQEAIKCKLLTKLKNYKLT